MFRYSREMIAYSLSHKTFVVALLIFQCFWLFTDAVTPTSHQAFEDASDKIQTITDQIALAADSKEPHQYRRGDNFGANHGENQDLNFITSDSKAALASAPRLLAHKPFNAKHVKRIRSEAEAQLALDEARTAEEYVAKAMQMHGARLKEPIRIPAEVGEEEEEVEEEGEKGRGQEEAERGIGSGSGGSAPKGQRNKQRKGSKNSSSSNKNNNSNNNNNNNNNNNSNNNDNNNDNDNGNDNYDYYDLTKKPIPHEMEQQQQHQYHQQQHQQQQQHLHYPQRLQQQQEREEQHQQNKQQQHQYHHYQQQQQKLAQQQYPYKYQQQEEQASAQELLQSQMEEAQLLSEQQKQQQQTQQQTRQQYQEQHALAQQQQQQQQEGQESPAQQPDHHQMFQQQQQEQQQQLEPQHYEALTERDPVSGSVAAAAAVAAALVGASPQHPAPVYEKEPVTRSYELYDSLANYESPAGNFDTASQQPQQPHQHPFERHYHAKHQYQPVYSSNEPASLPPPANQALEEKVRVSASTEIPKAEIMKQIEKSVLRYMKELEAEGKIIAAPPEYQAPPPKSYYKVVSLSSTEGKRASSGGGAVRPSTKYAGPPPHLSSYGAVTSHQSMNLATTAATEYPGGKSGGGGGGGGGGVRLRHHQSPKRPSSSSSSKQQYHHHTETESAYQAPVLQQHALPVSHQEVPVDALAPHVEFIYKIKAHAPLQTATVKTLSKPYALPLKSYDQFDHTAALENLEEFDLSHVVTPQEDEPPAAAHTAHSGKPTKLYFNSEIYHDINSLPYKPEYHKVKTQFEPVDYKGYSGNFAEPSPALSSTSGASTSSTGEALGKEPRESSASAAPASTHSDDGYPVMNPYQYVLKKESVPSQYEDALSAMTWEKPPRNKPLAYAGANIQKGLEYDSYSPKFNNNPEGYGYQHSYKPYTSSERERERERDREHSGHKHASRHGSNAKRGKRGGAPLPSGKKNAGRNNTVKDIEASLALRPPPKV